MSCVEGLRKRGASSHNAQERNCRALLADILWRGASWPSGWGVLSRGQVVDPSGSPRSVGVVPLTNPQDSSLMAIVGEIGKLHPTSGLGVPDHKVIVRPSIVNIRRQGSRGEKVSAFAWPENGQGCRVRATGFVAQSWWSNERLTLASQPPTFDR